MEGRVRAAVGPPLPVANSGLPVENLGLPVANIPDSQWQIPNPKDSPREPKDPPKGAKGSHQRDKTELITNGFHEKYTKTIHSKELISGNNHTKVGMFSLKPVDFDW